MAEFAALPLFTDAWVADTAHLSRIERGLYMDMLVLAWRTPGCRLPDDEAWLARKLRLSEGELPILRALVEEFWTRDGRTKCLRQKRLSKEHEHVRASVERQRLRAKARWNNDKEACRGNADTQGAGNAPTPTPTPTIKEEPPLPLGEPPLAPEAPENASAPEGATAPPKPKRADGSRLPEGWAPGDGDRIFATTAGLSEPDIALEAEKFADYWHGKPGKDGRKVDWPATWRNWCRRAVADRARAAPRNGQANGIERFQVMAQDQAAADTTPPLIRAAILAGYARAQAESWLGKGQLVPNGSAGSLKLRVPSQFLADQITSRFDMHALAPHMPAERITVVVGTN